MANGKIPMDARSEPLSAAVDRRREAFHVELDKLAKSEEILAGPVHVEEWIDGVSHADLAAVLESEQLNKERIIVEDLEKQKRTTELTSIGIHSEDGIERRADGTEVDPVVRHGTKMAPGLYICDSPRTDMRVSEWKMIQQGDMGWHPTAMVANLPTAMAILWVLPNGDKYKSGFRKLTPVGPCYVYGVDKNNLSHFKFDTSEEESSRIKIWKISPEGIVSSYDLKSALLHAMAKVQDNFNALRSVQEIDEEQIPTIIDELIRPLMELPNP